MFEEFEAKYDEFCWYEITGEPRYKDLLPDELPGYFEWYYSFYVAGRHPEKGLGLAQKILNKAD